MRPEEKEDLLSKGMWFVLALFIAFFVFGEIHDLQRGLLVREQAVKSLQRDIQRLGADCDRALANKNLANGVRQRYRQLYAQIPGPGDTYRVMLTLDDFGRQAAIEIREILMKAVPAKATDPLQPMSVTVHVSGSYEGLRTFLAYAEAAVGSHLAGLTFVITRLELTPVNERLDGSITFRVMRRVG